MNCINLSDRRLPALLVLSSGLLTFWTCPLYGTSFDVTFDASTSAAPPQFFSAFEDALSLYQAAFTDPITINLQVGWGEVDGRSLSPGLLGQNVTNQRGFFTYGQVRSALMSDAKSAADAVAAASLPVNDPTNGAPFIMSNAEAKALGLLTGNANSIDGWIGFLSTAPYDFDLNDRSAAGKYDFIGLAEHEISEAMGRYGMTQNGALSGRYSPIDLFRYTSPGVRDLLPQNGSYFSIDGGQTVINTFNGANGGDISDWLGLTPDSFNVNFSIGQEADVSPGDLTEMDVIGYDVTPEPSSWVLICLGCTVGLLVFRRHCR